MSPLPGGRRVGLGLSFRRRKVRLFLTLSRQIVYLTPVWVIIILTI